MAKITKISWTYGTLNFWEGCEKVSPGCKNCYAEERDQRFHNGQHWGAGADRKKSLSAFKETLRFNKHAADGRFIVCDGCLVFKWNGEECFVSHTGRAMRPTMFVMSRADG